MFRPFVVLTASVPLIALVMLSASAANPDTVATVLPFPGCDTNSIVAAPSCTMMVDTKACRELTKRFADFSNSEDTGADPTGSFDSSAKLRSAFATPQIVLLPHGTYLLRSDVTPPAGNRAWWIAPGTSYMGSGKLRADALAPYNTLPIYSEDARSSIIGSEMNGFANVFTTLRYVKTTGTSPVVALYAASEAAGVNSKGWGANIACITSNATGTCIGAEVDINMPAAGQGTGVSVNAIGANPGISALQINSNTIMGGWRYGLNFNNSGHTAASDALIQSLNSVAQYGLNISGNFKTAELKLPSFVVGPTNPGQTSVVEISGGVGQAVVSVTGSAQKADIVLQPKGVANLPGAVRVKGVLKLPAYSIASLPICNSVAQDEMAVVSDATTPTYRGALTGGGSTRTLVYCDGSSWTAH